jgi:hypothetical protein
MPAIRISEMRVGAGLQKTSKGKKSQKMSISIF